MGIFFTAGEKKVRPGVYQRYENRGGAVADAVSGIVAATFRSNWGPLGEIVTIDASRAAELPAQIGGGTGSTVGTIREAFSGGAVTVLAVRLGSGGTAGTATLKDTNPEAADAVELTAKYPGSRALKIAVRDKLGDAVSREFLVTEGSRVIEKITFPASESGEVDALIALINVNSAYFTAKKAGEYSGTGKLAAVAETAITAGTDPTVNNESYSDALALLEPWRFNCLCVDTEETAVHTMVSAYIDRVYRNGKLECFGCVGEKTSVAFETRCSHAKGFNNYNMVYVGSAVTDSTGAVLEGYMAAARIAGMIASTTSNKSLTHAAIAGAADLPEKLTNGQYEQAIKSGMLTFSTSSSGTIWIEQGITTLVTLGEDEDEGWKKIKRTKTRKELMARVSDSAEGLNGKVNNNSDGQANIIKVVKGVLDAMWREEKLLPGYTVELDSANPPVGDSAWFLITADDVDSIEKAYFTYGFRYAAATV